MNIEQILSELKSCNPDLEVEFDFCGVVPVHVFSLGDCFVVRWEPAWSSDLSRPRRCTVEQLTCAIEKAVQIYRRRENDLNRDLRVESSTLDLRVESESSNKVCGIEQHWGRVVLRTQFDPCLKG